jgi:ribosome-associated toxin RatA of RatAB toxin-antitoxin module
MGKKNQKTMTVERSCDILSSVERVWDIISDTDRDPEYWTGVRDIKILSKDGNTIKREAGVGLRAFDHTSRQTLVLDPKKSIKLTIAGSPLEGERNLVLVPLGKNNTRIDVSWRFEVKDVPAFVPGLVKIRISKATDGALKAIKEEAERAPLELRDEAPSRLQASGRRPANPGFGPAEAQASEPIQESARDG